MASYDIYCAGVTTVVHHLQWGLIFMAHHPNVQKKMQFEIDATIGERPAHCNDRRRMRYTDALLCEVLRFSASIRVIMHRVTDECELNGYRIPQNTVALINLYSVHRDPTIWPSPDRFDPESNFLGDKPELTAAVETTAEGSEERRPLVRTEYLIPFGLGKHQCIGEALARQELFLFFVAILQKFTVSAPDGDLSRVPLEIYGTGHHTQMGFPQQCSFTLTPRS